MKGNLYNAREAKEIARNQEFRAMIYLHEMGMATPMQLGLAALGTGWNPANKQHHRLLRRMHSRGLITYFTSPATRERVYYLDEAGAGLLLETWGSAEHWIPHIDFHGGRAGTTIIHQLYLNDLRLAIEDRGYKYLPERIIRTAWGAGVEKIPDAIIWRKSGLEFWPEYIPFALEYENSPRSETKKYLMIKTAENIIGKVVAGVIIVGKPGTIEGWKTVLARAERQPQIEVLSRAGKHLINININLLRFWTATTPEGLFSNIEQARTAHRKDGMTQWTWGKYEPWLGLREAIADPSRLAVSEYTRGSQPAASNPS